MANLILHKNGAYNLYTTIADGACYESALTLEQLEEVIRFDHGEQGMRDLPARLERAHKTGCSSMHGETLEKCISFNRAGPNETCLSVDEFVAKYLTLTPNTRMMMNKATEYLKKLEWSMGNGQCPECSGVPASWHGHPCHMTTETIGHEAECSLASALRDAGETPLMKGTFASKAEFEKCITESGFFGTRPKTKEGCPRYRAYAEKMQSAFDSAMWSAMSERSNSI